MIKEEYNKRKEVLLQIVKDNLNNPNLTEVEKKSLNRLVEIMNRYTFENRLQTKGLVTRVIIDSLQLDYSIGEKFIKFDNSIKRSDK